MDLKHYPYFVRKSRKSATPWLDVTEEQLRAWKGDFFGIYLPELVLDSCPDTRNGIRCKFPSVNQGIAFTQHYLNYTTEQRAAIRKAYKERGYTHFAVNLTDTPDRYGYSGTYPPCRSDDREFLNQCIREVWDDFILVGIVIGYHDVDTDAAVQQFLDLLDDPMMIRIVWPGMEMDQEASRQAVAERIQRMARMMPWALQYIQFSIGHGAGDTPEAEWWGDGWTKGQTFILENGAYHKVMDYDWPGAQNIPNLVGFLLDDGNFYNRDQMVYDSGDMLVRLQKHGYRWNLKRSFDVIAAEMFAYRQRDEANGEAVGVAHTDYLLDRAMYQEYTNHAGYTGRLKGFLNGGTIR